MTSTIIAGGRDLPHDDAFLAANRFRLCDARLVRLARDADCGICCYTGSEDVFMCARLLCPADPMS